MRPRRLLLVLSTLCWLLAACSDGGDGEPQGLTSAEREFADVWAASLSDAEDGFGVAEDDAACMAEAMMADLGAEPFEDADVQPDDIDADAHPGEVLGDGTVTDAQADAIMDSWEDDCVDLALAMAESVGGEFDLDAEGEACFADGLAEGDLARDLLRPSFTSESSDPDETTATAMLELVDSCTGGDGGAIVDSIATELAADGAMTDEQAQCIVQAVVDDIGSGRLTELFAGGVSFEDAEPEVQEQITGALLAAAGTCDVPMSAFGG